MDLRQIRGLQISKQKESIRKTEGGWLVQAQGGNWFYKVSEDFTCNCPDFQQRNFMCKHCFAVRFYLKTEIDTPKGTVVREKRVTYPQVWSAYTPAQNKEIQLFDELLKDLVEAIEDPEQQMGRKRLSLKEQVFCSIQKVYSQLSSRRAHSLFRNARERKQIERAPNYNAINKVLNKSELTILLHELLSISASPLKSVELPSR